MGKGAGESQTRWDQGDVHAECRKRMAEQDKRIAELEKELAFLKRKLAEIDRSQKRQAAPFSKAPPKENPQTPGRKPGAAYGLRGHRRPPEEVDEVYRVELPTRCHRCGSTRIQKLGELDSQYQEEVPRKAIRRRFDREVGQCEGCGARVIGRHQLQTSDASGAAAAQVGPEAQAMVGKLRDEIGLSQGKVCRVMQVFGVQLTGGGVAQIVGRVGRRIQAAYEGIQIVVRRSRIMDADETSWKVGGKLQWLWTMVTKTVTLFVVRPSRGADVLEEIVGKEYGGTIGHDGWAPYDSLEQAQHQQCWRHIDVRCQDLIEVAGGPREAKAKLPREISQVYRDSLQLRERRERGEISGHGLAVAVGRLYRRLYELVVVPKSWRQEENRKLARHMGIHFDQWFTFLEHPGVEPTSWRVDQASRFAIVNRKVFGGSRYEAGARAMERICSVGATCGKRGLDFFTYLSRVLCAPDEKRDRLACRLLELPPPKPA